MSTRLWYLRRGVAWLPLLGACVAAAVTAVLLARWPDDAFLLAPALLACCAAAAAFAYDEDALPVVAVTPRGAGWRRANRLGVTLVPLSVWALVVALRPGDVPFWRPGWWLLGGATVLLVAGSAALASRRLVPTPGALLAPVVALAAVAPVTLSGMFSWGTLYPIGDFPDPVRTVWLGVALSGAAVCAVALRPGRRHRRAGLDARRRAEGQGKDAGLAMRAAAIEAAPPASEGTHVSTATSPVHLTASTVWPLRLAGLAALVNGAGFGAFDIPGTWHLAHDHEIWHADGNPTYGNGPFEAHGISVTVPVLLAFFGTCLVLAIGGALLLAPRTNGVVVTLAGMVMCAPFWWGFDLPFAWFSAASILALLAMAWAAWMFTRAGPASRRWPDPGDRTISHPLAPATVGGGVDEPRALQRAGWAGAASVVVLAAGVTLCSMAGVDAPAASDAAILERLDDGAKQAAAGIGLPMLGLGVALLLWFATGLRRVLDRLSGGDPLAHAIVPAVALLGGLMITGVSLDVSSAITALATDEFTPDPDIARVLGTAGLVVALTGLTGGAVLVAVTTRIAHQARALPSWAVWVSYVVAVLCLSGFWSAGMASMAFALWLIGAVIGLLRSSRAPKAPTTPDADTSGSATSAQAAEHCM